MSQCSL